MHNLFLDGLNPPLGRLKKAFIRPRKRQLQFAGKSTAVNHWQIAGTRFDAAISTLPTVVTNQSLPSLCGHLDNTVNNNAAPANKLADATATRLRIAVDHLGLNVFPANRQTNNEKNLMLRFMKAFRCR